MLCCENILVTESLKHNITTSRRWHVTACSEHNGVRMTELTHKNTQHSTTSVPRTDIRCSLVWLCLEDQKGSLKRSKTPVMRLYRSSDLRWRILPHHRWTHTPQIMKNCRIMSRGWGVKQSFCVRPAETSCRHSTSALHSERDGNQTHKKSKEESSRASPAHSSPRYSQQITTRVSPFCLMRIKVIYLCLVEHLPKYSLQL